jgi:hypothetical protein
MMLPETSPGICCKSMAPKNEENPFFAKNCSKELQKMQQIGLRAWGGRKS